MFYLTFLYVFIYGDETGGGGRLLKLGGSTNFLQKKIKIILDHFPLKNKIIKSSIVDRFHQILNSRQNFVLIP
jgi:hypothetical protein